MNLVDGLSSWGNLIFVGIAVAVVLAVAWFAYRMQTDSEASARSHLRAAKEARDQTAEMRTLERGLSALLVDLRKELQTFREAPTWATPEQVQALADEWRLRPAEPAPAAGLAEAPTAPDARSAVRALEQEADLRRALAAKARLEGELSQSRERLTELRNQFHAQLKAARQNEEAQASGAALRRINEQLMAELKAARMRSRELESRLDPLTLELKALRLQWQASNDAAAAQAPHGGQAAQVDVGAAVRAAAEKVAALYSEQIEALQQGLSRSAAEMLQVKDELQRTLREKSFIEDCFLSNIEADEQGQRPAGAPRQGQERRVAAARADAAEVAEPG